MLSEEEFRIRLNKNMECDIFGLPIKQVTLDEVLEDIGYQKFKHIREFVNLSLDMFDDKVANDIEDYMLDVKEQLILAYPDVKYEIEFDLFDLCLYIPFAKTMFIDFLKTFTRCEDISFEHVQFTDEMLMIYFIDGQSNKLRLNRNDFNELIDLFSILNFTVRVDRNRHKDSASVKEFDKKANEIKEKYGFKSKSDVTLESITSALIDSDNPNYTHESIGSKTIYQIMNSFNRMCKMKDNEFMNLVRVNATKIKDSDIRSSMWYYNLY